MLIVVNANRDLYEKNAYDDDDRDHEVASILCPRGARGGNSMYHRSTRSVKMISPFILYLQLVAFYTQFGGESLTSY